jgi:hypothetical protein
MSYFNRKVGRKSIERLPRIFQQIKKGHQGTKAQRNTKGLIIKKLLAPWCPGTLVANIFTAYRIRLRYLFQPFLYTIVPRHP